MDLQHICNDAKILCKKVGFFIADEGKNFNKGKTEEKSFNQLVSYVDKTAEERLVAGLKKIISDCGFITEESTIATEQKEWMWIIDPLDGTTNFIHQIPVFSISVALQHNNETTLGIVYEVNRDEMFCAWKNGGAYLNDVRIAVSENALMSKSLMATGFPYYDYAGIDQYLATLKQLMKDTRGMRRMGSAAVDLAYVACGRFDGFFEYGLNAWDVAAGAFIVEEAGGKICDFSGGNNYIFGKEIIAASKNIQPPFFDLINKAFNKDQKGAYDL